MTLGLQKQLRGVLFTTKLDSAVSCKSDVWLAGSWWPPRSLTPHSLTQRCHAQYKLNLNQTKVSVVCDVHDMEEFWTEFEYHDEIETKYKLLWHVYQGAQITRWLWYRKINNGKENLVTHSLLTDLTGGFSRLNNCFTLLPLFMYFLWSSPCCQTRLQRLNIVSPAVLKSLILQSRYS